MTLRRYLQLDVFADRPGAGNPLAVVLDAEGLDDGQRIAGAGTVREDVQLQVTAEGHGGCAPSA